MASSARCRNSIPSPEYEYVGPGRKQQRQRPAHLVVAHPPVRQARAVRERHARRDEVLRGLIAQVVVSQVLRQGRVEIEPSLLYQLQHAQRQDRLRHRTGFEDRVGGDGLLSAHVAHAEALRPVHAAVLDDGDGHPGHVVLLHQGGHVFLQPCLVRDEPLVRDRGRRHDPPHGRRRRQPDIGFRVQQQRRDRGHRSRGLPAPSRPASRASPGGWSALHAAAMAAMQAAQPRRATAVARARPGWRRRSARPRAPIVASAAAGSGRSSAVGLVQGHRRGPALLRRAVCKDPVDGVEGIDAEPAQRGRRLARDVAGRWSSSSPAMCRSIAGSGSGVSISRSSAHSRCSTADDFNAFASAVSRGPPAATDVVVAATSNTVQRTCHPGALPRARPTHRVTSTERWLSARRTTATAASAEDASLAS